MLELTVFGTSLRFPIPFVLVVAVMALCLMFAACTESNDSQRSKVAQEQATTRGFNAVPPYIPSQYPAREDINWYLQETEQREVWYIYALAMDGKPLFYVVSDMKPRNICISITAPDRRVCEHQWGSGFIRARS